MYRIFMAFIAVGLITALTACGSESENNSGEETSQSLVPVEATFNIEENAEPGEVIVLETKVTQGDEAVEDAHEVLYEVWEANHKEHSEMIESTHEGEGVYTASYTPEDEAVYFVQVHVTARDTHVMPRMEITVGNPDMTEIDENQDPEEAHDHEEEEESDHDH